MNRSDPVMDDVYHVREAISASAGNDPAQYLATLKRDLAAAKAAGCSYLEFCLARLEASDAASVAAS